MSLLSEIQSIGNAVAAKGRENLDAQRRNTTFDLRESLRSNTFTQPDTIITEVRFLEYGIFLDRGRSPGKFAPPPAIQAWVKRKGIETDPRKIKSVAFLINRKIFREGIKPSRWLTRAIEFVLASASGKIAKAQADDARVFVSNLVNKTNRELK